MRHAKLPLIVAALLAASLATAGQLTPGLEAYLAEKGGDGEVAVLLVLADQVDVAAMDVDLHLQRTSLADRHFRVVTALQEMAAATQGPLLAELEARRGRGVTRYAAYWLINAVRLEGTEAAVRELAARPDVAVAEVDLRVELITPDSEAGKSGSRGIGITDALVNIGARRVWVELGYRGEGVLIGSLDTGVDGNHPALAARWRGNHAPAIECWRDFAGHGVSFPTDYNSHGTHTTGTMTGLAADDTIGVAPAAEWIAVNTIDQGASGGFDSDVLASLQFFTDPDGDPGTLDDVPDVVQNSWRVNESFSGYVDCDSRWWHAIDACEAAGVMLCWSAGNEGPDGESIGSPADRATTLYNCFSVGATSEVPPYNIAGFSSRGPAGPDCGPVENRVKPEIVAPGVATYSAIPGGDYGLKSGTSMAGPHVAGVVALMRCADPDIDVITIKQLLIETADDLGSAGEDNVYGHGLVDAYEVVLRVIGALGWVEGVVRDVDTGLPVDGAVVAVLETDHAVTTGPDGFYRFALPEGEFTLTAAAYGYEDRLQPVTIEGDLTLAQDLTLVPLPVVRLSGTVHAAGTVPPAVAPLAGATVRLADLLQPAVTTGADGRFEFFLPADGDHLLAAYLGGEGAISQTVPVTGDLDVDLYLGPPSFESFETGDLSLLPWISLGDVPWFVQDDHVHDGFYAAQAGPASSYESSALLLLLDCGDGGDLSFWYRVSSEAYNDYFRFEVDGTLNDAWSGEVGWTEHTIAVGPGTHSFSWSYSKNASVAEGHDTAWLDAISLPGGDGAAPMVVPAPWILDFGQVNQGMQATLPLVIMNQGREPLTVAVSSDAPWLSIIDGAATVPDRSYHVAGMTVDTAGLALGTHAAWIDLDSDDPANPHLTIQVLVEVTDGPLAAPDAPGGLVLLGAAPNPFNPATTIRYALPAAGHAQLCLYDVQGRLVRELVNGHLPAGPGEIRWDGRDGQGRAVASGTYLARLRADGKSCAERLLLVR